MSQANGTAQTTNNALVADQQKQQPAQSAAAAQTAAQPQANGNGHAAAAPAAAAAQPAAATNSGADAKAGEASEIRCLIDNHSVGCIIGKGGANVKRVRDETGVSISILKADNVKAVKERVMVLKGTSVALSKALQMVADRLVESANTSETKKQADTKAEDKDSTVIRLLVHRSAVGAVIGKAGAVIKETQSETNARVQVSNDPLPQSTEKTITVTGTPAAIQAALVRILNQLRDNPLKNQRVVPFVPGQQQFPAPQFGFNQQPAGTYPHQQPQMAQPYGAAGIYNPMPQQPQRQELAIPTHTAGGIIGKGGAVIRDLRAQSGTNISIADPEPNNPSERVVTVSGTSQGIQTAIYLIRQLVEQYQPPQAAAGTAAAPAAAQPQPQVALQAPQQIATAQHS